MCAKYGAHFSRVGNGICHYVHVERFARPGGVLIGADSHTTTSGALGMVAIGAGGLDVAVVMGGHPYSITCPEVVEVHLAGELAAPWVQGKDVILELLRRLSVTGGKEKVFEFTGPGVATLSVPEPTLIVAQPFDPSLMGAVEKAIRTSDLGLNPANDGKVVRIPIPSLTEERRKELSRHVHKLSEEGRNTVRQVRRDANDRLKKLLKDAKISQDNEKRGLDEVQRITDQHIKLIDDAQKKKDAELLGH